MVRERRGVLDRSGRRRLWRTPVKALWLTQDEACGLLQLSVASTADLGGVEDAVLLKLGDLCRAFFRDAEAR
jgi:hypothetical protein